MVTQVWNLMQKRIVQKAARECDVARKTMKEMDVGEVGHEGLGAWLSMVEEALWSFIACTSFKLTPYICEWLK